ncbi:hypothetical protein GGX14DRAFT_337680, partial [Mycena pura]
LDEARKQAEGGYSSCSAVIHAKIRNGFVTENPGKTAHEWQVDFAEAIELRLDCSLLADTGAGNTMPFI